MTYEIELFIPSARPGAAAVTETLGACKIISRNVFVTVTEHNGSAHLVLLDELTELDRTQPRYATVTGKVENSEVKEVERRASSAGSTVMASSSASESKKWT